MLWWLRVERQNWAQWAGLLLLGASGAFCMAMGLHSIWRGPALLLRLGRVPCRGQSRSSIVAAGRFLLTLGLVSFVGAIYAFVRGQGAPR